MRLILSFIIALAACGSAVAGPIPEPPAGFARLVIYRIPDDMSAVSAKKLWLDNKQVVALRRNGYTHVLVKAGIHELHDGEAASYQGMVAPVDAMSGEIYYFRYGSAPAQRPAKGDRRHWFDLVPEDTALTVIEHAQFQNPLIANFD